MATEIIHTKNAHLESKQMDCGSLNVASFFSGAGGLDIGFHEAGYNIIFASDFSEIKQKLYDEYEAKGMIKKNPNRVAGATSTVNFLKYEDILWNSLNLKGSSSGKPNNRFNWKSITEICSLPDL